MMRELKGCSVGCFPEEGWAAAQIPMMRELKGCSVGCFPEEGWAAAQIPMMRELKVSLNNKRKERKNENETRKICFCGQSGEVISFDFS